MKVQNSPSFCGKVVCPPEITGVGHLLTKKVKDTMRVAPKGSVLRFKEADFLDRCDIDFIAPNGDTVGFYELKKELTEKSILSLITEGIRIVKNGMGRFDI